MAGSNVKTLTEASFNAEVVEAYQPVLVDFWAEWCGPCKALGPILDDLATEYDGKAKFGKVNIDENPNLASEYSIRAVPTLLLFKAGQVEETFVGMKSKRDLKAALDQALE
jgi:thioredoxin 1